MHRGPKLNIFSAFASQKTRDLVYVGRFAASFVINKILSSSVLKEHVWKTET